MPRTVNGLWATIISFENLYHAFQDTRLGKRYQHEVMQYATRLEENLTNIQNHLIWKSWTPGPQREFIVREPKMRMIQAPPFADRVVHHALVRVVGPIFDRRFITDSYACREGKGAQRAVMRTQHFLRVARRNWGDGVYVLKADISKYFASIQHRVLMDEVGRVIADRDVIWLWQQILGGYGHEAGVGLPVGALTSQLGANIVLNRLDHTAKDDMGIRFYTRYMDDFVAILPDKAAAQRVLRALGEVVNSLGLSLNPKTAIHPWQRGIDYCGYRIWPTHILPRKRNIKRARADFRDLTSRYYHGEVDLAQVRERVMSFLAYAKHCNAHRTVEGVLADLVLVPGLRDVAERLAASGRAPASGPHAAPEMDTSVAFWPQDIPNLEFGRRKKQKG
ncbi:reverse transcriptase/maturase family protein [Bordetella hinzii]|uniref:reverse transcriptase/maturase family protein n=1 Tax=Bordetella hinzii TaxID=103855 RepID=UPI0009BD728E|nr:reverse transcriptase/maturase family protein [Bordetella hinzii]VEH23141.1 reverse transcriptase [Bordetella hinzii]VEH23149.1 reverse transcriptase [Bordetella hinzii]